MIDFAFVLQLPEHLGSVRTICQGKGSQFVVGSTRNSILQGTFELNFQEIVTGHVDEVWALATHPQQNQFLTAGYDNLLHLWDTLTHRAVWSSNIGVSKIINIDTYIRATRTYQIFRMQSLKVTTKSGNCSFD